MTEPTPGDTFVDDPSTGVKKMADVADDCTELLLEQALGKGNVLLQETLANGSSAHSIVRHSAARKFNQEDPIEAAATEMILQKNV